MTYMTDRKRAAGRGASGQGTEHFWAMTKSAVALLILVPIFVFTFGPTLGSSYEEAVAYYARPFPSIVAALTLAVGFMHFKNGAQIAIEDYTGGLTRKGLILLVTLIAYGAAATGLYAIVKLAL